MLSSIIRNFIWNFLEIYLFFSLFIIYIIYIYFEARMCVILLMLFQNNKRLTVVSFYTKQSKRPKKPKRIFLTFAVCNKQKLMYALSVNRTSLQLIVAMSLTLWMKSFKNGTGQSITFLFYVRPLQDLNKII